MNDLKKELIKEHAELLLKIDKINHQINNALCDNTDKVEYANLCIQVAAMKKYADCIICRLSNMGVVFDGRQWFEKVAHINPQPTIIPISKIVKIEPKVKRKSKRRKK